MLPVFPRVYTWESYDVRSIPMAVSGRSLASLMDRSSFGMSSYGRSAAGGGNQNGGGGALDRARGSGTQVSSATGGHVGSIGWQAPEVIADRVRLEGGQGPSVAVSDR